MHNYTTVEFFFLLCACMVANIYCTLLRLINLSDNIIYYYISTKYVCFIMIYLHHRRVNASPLSALSVPPPPPPVPLSRLAVLIANLIVQSQLYKNWYQLHAHACSVTMTEIYVCTKQQLIFNIILVITAILCSGSILPLYKVDIIFKSLRLILSF